MIKRVLGRMCCWQRMRTGTQYRALNVTILRFMQRCSGLLFPVQCMVKTATHGRTQCPRQVQWCFRLRLLQAAPCKCLACASNPLKAFLPCSTTEAKQQTSCSIDIQFCVIRLSKPLAQVRLRTASPESCAACCCPQAHGCSGECKHVITFLCCDSYFHKVTVHMSW